VLAIVAIALAGAGLLALLHSRNGFAIWLPSKLERFILVAGLAGLMAGIMIAVDSRVIFPADLNVLFPQSLLFYPVIDYAVQIIFHLLPLAVLLLLGSWFWPEASISAILWPSLLFVAMLEPILQITFFVGEFPNWTVAFIAFHIFVFNVIELALFQRYDFITMFSFRLIYYLLWHILWGSFRLRLLF
jgi:hypothetical protein